MSKRSAEDDTPEGGESGEGGGDDAKRLKESTEEEANDESSSSSSAAAAEEQEEQEEQEDGGALPGGPLKMGVVMAQAMDSPGQAPFGRQPVAATAADGNSDVITPIYVPIVCLNERKGGVFVTCIM
mgnify:CR=1 FL=1